MEWHQAYREEYQLQSHFHLWPFQYLLQYLMRGPEEAANHTVLAEELFEGHSGL